VVSHKSLSTKSPVHKSLSDIETAILIELQSIGNIPFSKNQLKVKVPILKISRKTFAVRINFSL